VTAETPGTPGTPGTGGTLLIQVTAGELRHPLPADIDSARRVIERLAQVVPADGIWSVEAA